MDGGGGRVVVVVAESKEVERWKSGGDEVEEGRCGEEIVKEFGKGTADDDLLER